MGKLSDDVLKATIAAYNACGGNEAHAAKSVGMRRTTFRDRLETAKIAFPDLVETKPVPPVPPVPLTLDEEVVRHREVRDHAGTAARLKEALGHIAALEDKVRDYEWAANSSFKPAQWSLPKDTHKKREHIPYLLTSDFQAGEVIREDETEAGYGYDTDIFQKRYRSLIDNTIKLSMQHSGLGWTFPGIIYARGGDAISGGLHEELRETDDMTPLEAVEVVFEAEAWGILQLAEAFGRVEVKAPGAGGNHDRDTMKPRTKNAEAHSYERLVNYMLKREFKNDKRVSFQVSKSFDVLFPIYDKNILLTHGDRIGSRGGQGFVGPGLTIMRGAQKVIAEQIALGRIIHRVDMGHHHYPMCLDWVMCNGCLPGYSEYAKSFRMRPSPPIQFLLFHHPKWGVVDIKPINLIGA